MRRRAFLEIRQLLPAVRERALAGCTCRCSARRDACSASGRPPRSRLTGARPRASERVLWMARASRSLIFVICDRYCGDFARQLHFQTLEQQRQAGEFLAEAVVQIAAQATLFAIGDFQDLLLERLALGDFLHRAHQARDGAVIAQRHMREREPAHRAVGEDPGALLIGQRATGAHRRRRLRLHIDDVLLRPQLPRAAGRSLPRVSCATCPAARG